MRKILLSLFFPAALYGQSTIQGKILNVHGEPASNANVLLLLAHDSSLVKAIISNKEGNYSFTNVAGGNYFIAVSFTGYQKSVSSGLLIEKNDIVTVDPIVLKEETIALSAVTVSVKKPLLEQKIDRLVINVENSITSAGNTVLEVLERSPGVMVDHQNNTVSMNGKNGVIIMINGKISRMPTEAIVQLLSGMSSGDIEKIELITTPPANLDAEGNAGYINIVLKENNNYGTNGSLSASAGYCARNGTITELNLNMNHRKGNINIYGNISYSRIKKPFTGSSYSSVNYAGNTVETFFKVNRTDTTPNFNARLGVDWQLSKKTVLGVLMSGYTNKYTQSENNTTTIYKNGVLDTTVLHANNEMNHWYNYSGNINLQQNFKGEDKLLLNVDYIYYNNDQPVNYNNSYYNKLDQFVYDQLLKSGKLTPIEIWVAAADYSKRLSKKVNLEAGLKQAFSDFNNNISLLRFQQNIWVKDTALSNVYQLKENYSAAYATANASFNENTSAKFGLRYEYTNSNLGTETTKNIVDRHYGNFFPTFFFSQKLDDKNSLNFSYSRRITRPTFNDLAPFTYYIDANTLLTGNSALQPAISDNFSTAYSYRKYLLTISFSNEENSIAHFQPRYDSASDKLILTSENLINVKTVSGIISLPVTVNQWWSMQYNVTVLWQQSNAWYKTDKLKIEQANFNINVVERFTLPKDFSIELSGFYQSASLMGIYKVDPQGTVDVGIKKKLKGKNGSLIFNANNIFNTLSYSFNVNIPEQNLVTKLKVYPTAPTFKLTYTRNFGNDKLKEKRDRSTGAEDEKNRVNN